MIHYCFGTDQGEEGRGDDQSPGRERIDYECNIDDIDNEENEDDFEKGETIFISDYANDDVAVSMIPDIADIISVGDYNDDGSGDNGESYWLVEKADVIDMILAAATAGI